MQIGAIKEKFLNDNRVALTPEVTQLLSAQGHQVAIESHAGLSAGFADSDFTAAGAIIYDSWTQVCQTCDILFKIWAPLEEEWKILPPACTIIADFSRSSFLPRHQMQAFALNKIPRISRAQTVDIISSQSNLAGYKAALLAFDTLPRIAPMMITSAGTLPPLNVFIWGLGVAGLQAAATSKRLGAKTNASDIRSETEEQAASVGAFFIPPSEILAKLPTYDIIITSAGSYGNAPLLISPEDFASISAQSLILDISGNVAASISAPNLLRKYNLPSLLANSASRLFANNLYNFFQLLYPSSSQDQKPNFEDEIIRTSYLGDTTHA